MRLLENEQRLETVFYELHPRSACKAKRSEQENIRKKSPKAKIETVVKKLTKHCLFCPPPRYPSVLVMAVKGGDWKKWGKRNKKKTQLTTRCIEFALVSAPEREQQKENKAKRQAPDNKESLSFREKRSSKGASEEVKYVKFRVVLL